jgi:hypothetical protein
VDSFALPFSQYTSVHLLESRTRKAAYKNLFLTELINSTDTKVLGHKFYNYSAAQFDTFLKVCENGSYGTILFGCCSLSAYSPASDLLDSM